ncbi:MAG: hypothetical protein ACI9OJ_001447 [Myxococcota bacterium]|jgi:hypothetical protein
MISALLIIAALGTSDGAAEPAAAAESPSRPSVVRGRLDGYRGLYPFHIAILKTRDLATPNGPVGWATADPETGVFDVAVPDSLDEMYLFGHLDLERTGPRLDSGMLFFLRKLPIEKATWGRGRLIFDLGDMELAHVMRDKGLGTAPFIAFGLAFLLYGIGWFWARRLPKSPPPPRSSEPEQPGWPLWLIVALGAIAPIYAAFSEPLELLEFTYLHEGLRPASILKLLIDPISSELSHPPLWPFILRSMAAISRQDWWLRLPSLVAHAGFIAAVGQTLTIAVGRRAGLFAAAIASLHGLTFYYAADAAPYSALGLVAAIAISAALQEKWARFSGVLIIGFFIHYTVGVLGVALGLALLWHYRSQGDAARFRRALIAFGWVSALPLVWSVHFIRTFLASGMSTRLMSVDYLPDPGFLSYVGQFARVVVGLPESYTLVAPVMIALLLYGAVAGLKRAPLLGRIVAVQLVMVVVYVLFVHVMYMRFAGGRVFYAFRWASVFMPTIVAAYAFALDDLARRFRPAIGVGALLIAGHAMALLDVSILTQPQRPDQGAAAELIRAERQPNDAFAALPAVYYGQLFNYHLYNAHPEDLLAWPRWEDGLYGPLHPVNTSLETLTKNLAFGRVWVAVFDERMFGQPKFDAATSEHQLAWMREHLVADGRWAFDHLTLYRFRVPAAPKQFWTLDEVGNATVTEMSFNQTIKNFRYFPELLHTQRTGMIMSAQSVHLRLPTPIGCDSVTATFEMALGRETPSDSLSFRDRQSQFVPVVGGGRWTVSVPCNGPVMDFHLDRSEAAASDHRSTIVTLTPNRR